VPIHSHGETEAEGQVLAGLRLAVELSLVILAIEAAGAYFSHSLALTVDAIHNLPDILAFALSWSAIRASSAGATDRFTFGAHRLETFAGLLNAALVLGTGAVFGYEALSYLRLGESFAGPVDPVWILAAALPTLGLRAVNLSVLRRIPGRVRDLNLRSVVVHLASDLAITGSLLVAGAILLLRPALSWIDPFATLVISVILVYESLPLFGEGWDILTERTPRGLSVERITATALSVPGVVGVHDLHVWSVCSTMVVLTAHVDLREMTLNESMVVVSQLRKRIERDFGIVHSTFEVEGPSMVSVRSLSPVAK
jgi:cobalt-zinc-cadmium efflux system protein